VLLCPPDTASSQTWAPPRADSKLDGNRSINVYTNSKTVSLEVNGKEVARTSDIKPYENLASFSGIKYAAGTLTAKSWDGAKMVGSHTVETEGVPMKIVLSLDMPSASSGTGSAVVADGEDAAMVRATIVDSSGKMVPSATTNITFAIKSGDGKIWTTHNGDPANLSPNDATWNQAYHGLARAIVRSSKDSASPAWHRRRLMQIDVHGGRSTKIADPDSQQPLADVVLMASAPGMAATTISIPMTNDLEQSPLRVAQTWHEKH